MGREMDGRETFYLLIYLNPLIPFLLPLLAHEFCHMLESLRFDLLEDLLLSFISIKYLLQI